MLRALLFFIPRFVTVYLVVSEGDYTRPNEHSFTGVLVKHLNEVPKDKTCIQMRYLTFLGYRFNLKVAIRQLAP